MVYSLTRDNRTTSAGIWQVDADLTEIGLELMLAVITARWARFITEEAFKWYVLYSEAFNLN